MKCEEELERMKVNTYGTGGVVQSGEEVGVDSRGGGDNEEGEDSGGTGGEIRDIVKDNSAGGGGRETLKLAQYICGRRQERGHMTRGSGEGKGEWGQTDFDGMYSSPLDRAVAMARGLGSAAAALWQRGHAGAVAVCLLRRCACVSLIRMLNLSFASRM